jgi:hypothetical protein
MTAEVGVMNRFGIALAADSAVTVGGGTGKIYTSAEKLFLLSEAAPVGIMVYGNAILLGVPWETIIKSYRKDLGFKTFSTLPEYVEHFLGYLSSNETLFPAAAQEQSVLSLSTYFFQYILSILHHRLEQRFRQEDFVSEDEIESVLGLIAQEQLELTQEFELLCSLPESFPKKLQEEYGNAIDDTRVEVLGSFPTSDDTRDKLLQVVSERISRQHFVPLGVDSGVVVAGFGEDEYYPRLVQLDLRGIAANQVLYAEPRNFSVGKESEAWVLPFAQREMVHTFMEGIDPSLRRLIEESVATLLSQLSQVFIDEARQREVGLDTDFEQDLSEALEVLLTKLIERWDAERRSSYSDPVMKIVARLPKDELAAMAESLVNMTKFKRRVSEQQETVGGPIDVVVITKGDGFVWIKRKYYFKSDLNPRFMARYHEDRREQ